MARKKYRFFLFDLDNTLWDFDANASACILELVQSRGLSAYIPDGPAFYKLYKTFNDRLWIRYESGEISQKTLRQLRFSQAFEYVGVPNAKEEAADFGTAYLDLMPTKTALVPYALEVLEYMKQRECKMALISNGFKCVQDKKIHTSGLDVFFGDRVFVSEEVGYHKPNPKIFIAAITAINGRKKETLMVGDNVANDIEGAQVFGIDQFYYNPRQLPCDCGPTYEGRDLRDLLALVQ